MTAETWRPVVGYEGYEVSDRGRVRSPDRRIRSSYGATRRIRGRLLRQCQGSTGYLQVALCTEGTQKTRKVHQLVAEAFIGPRPPGLDTDHIDRDRLNNRLDNLRYLAHGENIWRDMRGKRHPNSRLTEEQVWKIRRRCEEGDEPQGVIGLDFDVTQTTVSDIMCGRTWSYLT